MNSSSRASRIAASSRRLQAALLSASWNNPSACRKAERGSRSAARGDAHDLQGRAQLDQVGPGRALCSERGGARLHRDPEVDQLVELAGHAAQPAAPGLEWPGQLGDERATGRATAYLQVAALDQLPDPFAHADARHAELLGELPLRR